MWRLIKSALTALVRCRPGFAPQATSGARSLQTGRAPAPITGRQPGAGLGRYQCAGKVHLPRCCRRRPRGRQQTR
eukprot:12853652-Alexandrium_andersonii.AAC.1